MRRFIYCVTYDVSDHFTIRVSSMSRFTRTGGIRDKVTLGTVKKDGSYTVFGDTKQYKINL